MRLAIDGRDVPTNYPLLARDLDIRRSHWRISSAVTSHSSSAEKRFAMRWNRPAPPQPRSIGIAKSGLSSVRIASSRNTLDLPTSGGPSISTMAALSPVSNASANWVADRE